MRTNNQRISRRQASWMLVLNLLAAGLFSLTAFSEPTSVVVMLLSSLFAIVIAAGYDVILFKLFELYEKKTGGVLAEIKIPIVLNVLLLLLSAAGLVWSLQVLHDVISDRIPFAFGWPIAVFFLMAAMIDAAGKGVEVHGRLAEWMGWLIIVPLTVLFGFGIWQILKSDIWQAVVKEVVESELDTDFSLILSNGFKKAAFLLIGVHPLILWRFMRTEKEKKGLSSAVFLIAGLLLMTGTVITVFLLSPEGIVAEQYPFGVVLQLIRFPGNFISRYDIFFVMLWMMSYFIFAGGMLLQMVELMKSFCRKKEKNMQKKLAVFSGILIVVFFLCGCYAEQEPQNRHYIMCIGIDSSKEGSGWRVSYGFPDLSALTGTDVGEAEKVRVVDAASVADAAGQLNASSDKTTDYSQMPVILIAKSILEDDDKRTKLMTELASEKAIRRTALIACAKYSAEEIMALDADVQGSIGVFIYELCQNNYENKGYTMSILEDFIGGRMDSQTVVPVLGIQDDIPEIIQLISP